MDYIKRALKTFIQLLDSEFQKCYEDLGNKEHIHREEGGKWTISEVEGVI